MLEPSFGFISFEYQRHNQRRLEHLAGLGLDLSNKHVLELGAGIGDHTSFFLDRNCEVTISEPRKENLEILKLRFPTKEILSLDLESPSPLNRQFDIVYCYGVLYHLADPEKALRFMA
ncbi:MAG: class I SAM-dependent methyltransferase, partial [Candidatus Obscuribacterales bacterium]|nr:class I SAM-dependent methyltransferase [Candidatus Obscuribacterales bacterium]